jgi:AFG3 family protein
VRTPYFFLSLSWQALLRPGRFDRTVTIDLPDIRGRKQIFEIHLQRITVTAERSVLAESLAALTPGFRNAIRACVLVCV